LATIQFMDESDWGNIKVGYEVAIAMPSQPDFSEVVTEVQPGLVTAQARQWLKGAQPTARSRILTADRRWGCHRCDSGRPRMPSWSVEACMVSDRSYTVRHGGRNADHAGVEVGLQSDTS
jgi:hypothetical protein